MSLSRRDLLLGLGGLAVTGCAAPGSAVYQVVDAFRALDRAKKQYPVSRETIEAQSAGVLGAQVEGGLKGLVVWQKRENRQDYWRSGNGVVIVTEQGRLIRTSGFPQDQIASRLVSGFDPLGTLLDRSRGYQMARQLDWLPDQYGQLAEYELSYATDRTIDLQGQAREVAEWAEVIRFPKTRRRWKQLFQVDPRTGQVLRTIQHVGPEMRVILELLKAPVVQQT